MVPERRLGPGEASEATAELREDTGVPEGRPPQELENPSPAQTSAASQFLRTQGIRDKLRPSWEMEEEAVREGKRDRETQRRRDG